MSDLISILIGWPTAPLTALMAVAVLYWIFVILGACDIDLIPFDGDHSHDLGHGNPNVALEFLRIGKVPVTIILSIFVLSAWIACLLGSYYLRGILPAWSWWLVGGMILTGSLVGAFFITGLAVRPLAGLLTDDDATTGDSLVGRMVTVTSSTVDDRFGTAHYSGTGNQDIILNVVCRPEHRLAKGESAVVMEHDPGTGVYTIAPLPHTRPGFLAETDAPPAAVASPQSIQPPTQPQ